MRRFFYLLMLISAISSCNREELPRGEDESTVDEVAHGMIVLGKQLEDPYSVKNMNRALEKVYPLKAERHEVSTTDLYVRFLPDDEQELEELQRLGLDLLDHPLDYQIVRDGDYFHDPGLDKGVITWQYAVVKKDFKFPYRIHHEVLEDCFIPEHDVRTKSDGLDWDKVVREAYRLTGNEDLLFPQVRSGGSCPSGRITIEDEQFAGGKPIGVAGVKVVCNSFVKCCSAYTDRDGYYVLPKSFSSKIRYRLMFQNEKGFNIGFNWILVPASMSALGKGSADGIDVHIHAGSDRKLFCRSVINNAVYDYLVRVQDWGILSPPDHLRIWLLQKTENSSAVMMRNGTVLNYSFLQRYVGEYIGLLKLFLPDLTLGLENKDSYKDLYRIALHECAHASHFKKVGIGYWNHYINYILKSYFRTGSVYGDGKEEYAGYCAVGEMWAYFLENVLMHERYGGKLLENGQDEWFFPQILMYLYERGLTPADIFQVMDSEICSREELKEALGNQFPEKKLMINQAFDKYIY